MVTCHSSSEIQFILYLQTQGVHKSNMFVGGLDVAIKMENHWDHFTIATNYQGELNPLKITGSEKWNIS